MKKTILVLITLWLCCLNASGKPAAQEKPSQAEHYFLIPIDVVDSQPHIHVWLLQPVTSSMAEQDQRGVPLNTSVAYNSLACSTLLWQLKYMPKGSTVAIGQSDFSYTHLDAKGNPKPGILTVEQEYPEISVFVDACHSIGVQCFLPPSLVPGWGGGHHASHLP